MTDKWLYPAKFILTTQGVFMWDGNKCAWVKDLISAEQFEAIDCKIAVKQAAVAPAELPAFEPAPEASEVAWW